MHRPGLIGVNERTAPLAYIAPARAITALHPSAQFEIAMSHDPKPSHPETRELRQQAMTDALREWDPDAEIQWDAESGKLAVFTSLPGERVATILATLGEPVSACGEDDKPSSGEGCCGCCSH